MALAQHSSATNEAYTPARITEPARAVLGYFDLDPASCELGQQQVGAKTYYSANGLFLPWYGRVFLNPPGGKLDSETLQPFVPGKGKSAADGLSSAAVWWTYLCDQWMLGAVECAIYVCFSLSVFRTAQGLGATLAPYELPMCVPSMRINYDKAVNGVRVPSKGAPADSAIIFLPPRLDKEQALIRFQTAFAPLGRVRL